jgi:hypothetical protein
LSEELRIVESVAGFQILLYQIEQIFDCKNMEKGGRGERRKNKIKVPR